MAEEKSNGWLANSVGAASSAGAGTDSAVTRMQVLIDGWSDPDNKDKENPAEDRRVIFLHCYLLMTKNMLGAIERKEFHDSAWVGKLLHRFAEYYFNALDLYESGSPATPPVWHLTFQAARRPSTLALQNLLLGVNAHINYDLALALVDILDPEWASLTEDGRQRRYKDHCRVNLVIGKTVDAVQDQVLEPEMPVMDIIDRIMGRVDEAVISRLLAHWRDEVWQRAVLLLETQDIERRKALIQRYEKEVIRLGEIIQLRGYQTLKSTG